MLTEIPVKDFVAKLASDTPTPGGGAVAALSGAMSAALLSMVLQISLRKKKDAEEIKKIKEIIEDCNETAKRLTSLIDEDAEAFDKVMEAYKMPKKSIEEKNERKKAIQEQLKSASLVPLEVMKNVKKLFNYFDFAIMHTLKSTMSDIGTALLLADTAIKSASYNVDINLKLLKDEEFKKKVGDEASEIISFARDKLDDSEKIFQEHLN